MGADEALARIRVVADDLFAAALEVDRSGVVPASHWQRLADEGLYGVAAPPDAGGPGLELPEIIEGLETMAGGCLATTFTWMQHHGVVLSLSMTENVALREALLADAAAGRVRCGVAFAGVVPDPPRMTARRDDAAGGWWFTGDGPFVSGWGIVHKLQVSAGDVETGDVVAGVIDAVEQPGFTSVERQDLVAADATATVSIRLDDLFVPDALVVSRVPRSAFLANQAFGARLNGTLPIGLSLRCARLLEEAGGDEPAAAASSIRAQCEAVRGRLDAGLFGGDISALVAARADGAQLALRAAATLVAAGGGPALLRSSHAQRLVREATFTLVAASRPELKRLLVQRLSAEPSEPSEVVALSG